MSHFQTVKGYFTIKRTGLFLIKFAAGIVLDEYQKLLLT